ncbi:MAG: hypothetical protein H6673_02160 [Anaerolineales bacterium]|nr:hypothetical protein [Anaerolineales bacterium]
MNEALQQRIEAVRQKYNDLLKAVAMDEVTKELGDTATQIAGLPGKIQEIRAAGYAYANYLEHKAETLDKQWIEVREQIQRAIREELEKSQQDVMQLDSLWDQLDDAIAKAEGREVASKPTGMAGLSGVFKAALEEKEEAKSAGGGMLGSLSKSVESAKKPTGLAGAAAAALSGGQAQEAKPSGGLGAALGSAMSQMASQADESKIEAFVGQIESTIERVSNALNAAKQRIHNLYGQVPSNVSQTYSQIRDIEGYLEQAKSATFDFLADEDLYMVVKAEWKKTGKGKDDPDGFLYITNRRLIMEQDEKKGGFMGFGGKKAEGLLWEAPAGSLEKVSSEKKGMLGGIDLIHIQFGSGGPFGDTTIEVKGGIDAKVFASKLQQVANGDIEKERGVERNQALVDAIAELPTTCPVCGATFNQDVVRGMTQLECAYCGSVVRIGS